MNLKFYLRGLGIGIVVTAIIMLVLAAQNKTNLSDSEIKERAQALGMVDGNATLTQLAIATPNRDEENINKENALAQIQEDDVKEDTQKGTQGDGVKEDTQEGTQGDGVKEDTQEEKQEVDVVEESQKTHQSEDVSNEENMNEEFINEAPNDKLKVATVEENKIGESNEGATDEEGISFKISSGEGSYTVAKHLQDLGLVEDAMKFDEYLCQTGLDRRLSTGVYSIIKGSTEEEIANKIAGR